MATVASDALLVARAALAAAQREFMELTMKSRADLTRGGLKGFTGLETTRLILRKFRASDLDAFSTYRADPQVARFQGWAAHRAPGAPLYTRREAKAFIKKQMASDPSVRGQWFQFAIELKSEQVLIGDCGLKVDSMEPRIGEIGFTLATDRQGQGFATEAVGKIIDYTFKALAVHRIAAITDCRNTPSVALLNRLGFKLEGRMCESGWCNGGWVDEYLYAFVERPPVIPATHHTATARQRTAVRRPTSRGRSWS